MKRDQFRCIKHSSPLTGIQDVRMKEVRYSFQRRKLKYVVKKKMTTKKLSGTLRKNKFLLNMVGEEANNELEISISSNEL